MSGLPFAAEKDGVRLFVRLTPRGSRNEVDGVKQGADGRPALHIRLAAPPVEGAANKALVAFLGDALDLRKRDVEIRSGGKSRTKTVHLSGDPAVLLARLKAWIG